MRMIWALLGALFFVSGPVFAQGFGFQPAPPGKFGAVPKALSPLLDGPLPVSVDLSDDMPAPGHQGNQQSCVAWAVAYALKSQQERIERGWPLSGPTGLHLDHVFSPSFVYNQINGGTDQGSNFGDAFRVLITQGAAPLSAMPYTSSPFAPVSGAAKAAASDFRIETFRRLDASNVAELKTQLAAGFPVVIAGRMYQQFTNLGPGQIWSQASGPIVGRHAMALVGYDDTKGAFKVINSWGTEWGSNGYGWISYDLFGLVMDEAYLVVDLKGGETGPVTAPADPWKPPVIPSGNATITITNFQHNQFDANGAVGMIVTGTISIPSGVEGTARIVISLASTTGTPVGALSPLYRLSSGQAAFGTPPLPLTGAGLNSVPWYAFMPYCALDVPKSKICIPAPTPPWVAPVQSNLRAMPALFIDNFGVAQGPALNFYVRM